MFKPIFLMVLSLWISSYSLHSHALLTAKTAHFIEGNAPRFNNQLEKEIILHRFSLLKFNYLQQVYPNNQMMPLIDPLKTVQDFIQQVTLSPMTLNEADTIDDDGDGEITANIITTSATVLDKNNQILDPMSTFCEHVDKAPITLQLNAELKLSTRYGVPNTTPYSVTQHYTLSFKPTICYLKPSLTYGSGYYAGLTTHWNEQQGFIYDASKTSFPTTGMDGLSYDVKLIGVDVLQEQINTIYSHLANVSLQLTPVDSQTLNVKLSGPTANNPKTFTSNVFNILIGPITYQFKINHWFIHNNDQSLTWANANSWCNGLGGNQRYQLPAITQLSNASQDVSGQTGVRNYTRATGQGFLPEWGSLVSYGLMSSDYIWSTTLRPNSGGHYYDAHNVTGSISSPIPTLQEKSLCVSK